MSELIKDRISRWSLERLKFVLAHIESFVEDDSSAIRDRARAFTAQTGLETVERLIDADPGDPDLPVLVLHALAPFFDSGLLVRRGPGENSNWWITDLFWRGSSFHVELNDQIRANSIVPEMTPLQVHKAAANKVLTIAGLSCLIQDDHDVQSYLLRPAPAVAFVLISSLPAPWAVDHVRHAHRLINKAFLF